MKKDKTIFAVEKLRVEREAVILSEVNWRVESGQHWAILGANGSGKTSLLRALTGYLMPTRGEVHLIHSSPSFVSNFPVQVFAYTCAQNVSI